MSTDNPIPLRGIFLSLLISILGCGGSSDMSEVVRFQGTITYNGEPLEGVSIHFLPAEGRESSAISTAGGRFVMRYTHDVDGVRKGPGTFYLTMPVEAGTLAGSQSGPQSSAALEAVKKYSLEKTTLQANVTQAEKGYELKLD